MKNILPKKLEAIFLDFDGVVVESSNIKSDAFYEVYKSYGEEIATKARDYHIKYQGISRFAKFKEIHKIYLGKECTSEEEHRLSELFSSIVLDKVLICPLVEGVIDFIESNKNIPFFLLSATPHTELLHIVSQRQLDSYFLEIYGAPTTKIQAGEQVIKKHGFSRENIIFFGDSMSDYEASFYLTTKFVGRCVDIHEPFPPHVVFIHTFNDLM